MQIPRSFHCQHGDERIDRVVVAAWTIKKRRHDRGSPGWSATWPLGGELLQHAVSRQAEDRYRSLDVGISVCPRPYPTANSSERMASTVLWRVLTVVSDRKV